MTAPVLGEIMGPRARRRVLVLSIAAGAALAGFIVLALLRLDANDQLDADRWRPFTTRAVQDFFLDGAKNTVRAAVTAMVIALAAGGFIGLARLSRSLPPRLLAAVYVQFFRGLPLYVLILFCGFGLPRLDVRFGTFWFLVMALSIYNSAVLAEIFRAGILSLDRGQSEAAYAIGLGYWPTMAYVVVPQAVRRMVPALVSQLVTLLKDTSLGGLIFYDELLRRARINAEFTQRTLPSLVVVAVIYIIMNAALSRLASWLETRQSRRYGASRIEVDGVEDLAVKSAMAAAAKER